ncbi:DUF4265 domain-containing protein [Archangium violaceum]|uniref:DUF4265 domain-containing protein n=1 Tax=Archangium violaceum TaxID=83451 RepID=UPI00194EB7A8|nr:DUF4265 domain-containing protein [Archangium violaceum]QRN96917.1 DUF4265 domain-containing protein [Archangium violaceum]
MPGEEQDGRSEGLVKLTFPLDASAWHGSATEILWAEKVTDSQYRLRNTPFYAYGVSAEDVVFAREQDGRLVFAGVARHGGHSTYRIIKAKGSDPVRFQERWAPLQKLGCSYEEGPGGLLAVDVPPELTIHAAYSLLEQGEEARVWSFEEGHCGHPLQVQR